jgi:hypothetical protein
MSSRRLAALAALCGAVALAGWGVAGHFGSPRSEDSAAPVAGSPPSVAADIASVEPADAPQAVANEDAPRIAAGEDAPRVVAREDAPHVVASEEPAADPPVAPALPAVVPQAETPAVQLASLGPSDAAPGEAKEAMKPLETSDECFVVELCIDRYLYAVYERTPKLDTVKESQQVKVTVKKNGKTRTVTKTVVKLVDEDFGWKDPKAAERAGMSLQDYVIGGMDPGFKVKLYHALRAMDDAGLMPGITSGFRDDYRQSIASGKKAASDSSYHGGSRRGGYGHGLAADLVSVKGDTRAQRWITSEALWQWVDAHGQEYGVGRPYRDRDPPHVGPIDGKEYADKRGQRNTKQARSETNKRRAESNKRQVEPNKRQVESNKRQVSAVSNERSRAKSARTAAPKARSI